MTDLERLFSLRGQVSVVTGASSGLGVEFAEALAAAGADLVLLARRRVQLESVASRLSDRYAIRAVGIQTDIEEPAEVEAAFAEAERAFGRVDVLVNNAGIAPTGRAETQWPDAWNATIRTNLTSLFHCCLTAASIMRRGGRGGRIINVSSIFGRLGSPLFRVSAYAASKGGVETLTRQLAIEWAPDGITVNAIAPAWFESEMTAGSLQREGVRERMSDGSPMQRLGRAGELKTACLFLASPASSYVTGTTIPVDGGYTAW